ncbi:hypothetical protein GTP23_12095 [Pseudoduganella sp. FT93W]|uniref:Uncharacterized protein n=1 Tax=Duganella fentianensis TaxID=2692177 RepID=A0A845I4C5_9BURK|nr:hypothetical protein [Duganella fentianensis]MYN45788.1 hypothetical protein [Duganella fentianensis]
MSQTEMTKLAMALGLCYAAYKFVGNPLVKAAAVSVGAVIVARKAPILSNVMA